MIGLIQRMKRLKKVINSKRKEGTIVRGFILVFEKRYLKAKGHC